MVSDFKRSIESQGTTLEAYLEATDTTVEKMVEDLKPQAANNVKTGLVLDAVAKAEGIEASDEEISAVVARMAAGARVDAKSFEARLRKSGRIEPVRWQIVRDKAADFIMANAVGVAPTPTDDSAEVEEPAQAEAASAKAAPKPAKKAADQPTSEAEEPAPAGPGSTTEDSGETSAPEELAEAEPAADTLAEDTRSKGKG